MLALGDTLQPVRSLAADVLVPVRRVGERATRPLSTRVQSAAASIRGDNAALRKQITQLRKELDDAKAASLRYDDAVRQRRELLALQGFRDPDGMRSIAAEVSVRSLNNFDETIEINQGTTKGVVKGAPVVTGAGLVGVVRSVSRTSAIVALLTDPSFSVGVRLARSGDLGVARGKHQGEPLEVDLIDLETVVARHEVLLTSGLNASPFPGGIPVARVRNARKGSIHVDMTADPVVDLQQVSFVKVLLPTTGSAATTGPLATTPPATTPPATTPPRATRPRATRPRATTAGPFG